MCVLLLTQLTLYPDQTCFVPSERVYDCGDGLSELECEEKGCCYNASASIQCYYPSGMPMHNLSVSNHAFFMSTTYVRTLVYVALPMSLLGALL